MAEKAQSLIHVGSESAQITHQGHVIILVLRPECFHFLYLNCGCLWTIGKWTETRSAGKPWGDARWTLASGRWTVFATGTEKRQKNGNGFITANSTICIKFDQFKSLKFGSFFRSELQKKKKKNPNHPPLPVTPPPNTFNGSWQMSGVSFRISLRLRHLVYSVILSDCFSVFLTKTFN